MMDKVTAVLSRYTMLQQGIKVTVGLSGGADSVALLHFLLSVGAAYQLDIAACHLNHRLRGSESMRDELFVREHCESLGVPLYSFSEDIAALAKQRGLSVEEAARERRYSLFLQVQGERGGVVATAHTLTDNVETVLFRMARGTGPRGLCGIPPVRGVFIRPLIGVSRREILDYCAKNNLLYMTDSTNLLECCARNIVRHSVAPPLARINQRAEENIALLIEDMRQEQAYFTALATTALEQCTAPGGYHADSLLALPDALCRKTLQLILEREGHQSRRRRILELLSLLEKGGGRELTGGQFVKVEGGVLSFFSQEKGKSKQTDLSPPAFPLNIDEGAVVFGKKLSFLLMDYEHFIKNENNTEMVLKNALDYDRIDVNALIRGRSPGDWITLPGRNCTKTLKKLLNEQKVPINQRGRRVVLAQGSEVLWLEGFGAHCRCAPTKDTRRVLIVTITREENENA